MKLTIATPDKEAVSAQVESVVLPGALGEMEVLPQHTFLISLLHEGVLSFRSNGKIQRFDIGEGHVEVSDDVVTCLVDHAEAVSVQ